MIDVAAFLIEHFPDSQACPNGSDLGRMLEAAGFDEQDIRDALTVMQLLHDMPAGGGSSGSLRIYHPAEIDCLDTETRGLLHFLSAGRAIDAAQRELIIHALMHLADEEITQETAKVVTLLVLWAHRSELPVLIGDELMEVLHGKGVMH